MKRFLNWKLLVLIIFICAIAVYFLARPAEKIPEYSLANFPPDSYFLNSAVSNANDMLNKPYDPLMGKFFNIYGLFGYVVCIDVPVNSYRKTGILFSRLLKKSAREHPEWFEIDSKNSPDNSFFYRRVRNYSPLFRKSTYLSASLQPQPGDWAFYGNHVALVISVDESGFYKVIEANPNHEKVIISDQKYMERTWGKADFFGRIKDFKNIYALNFEN